jgi:hypothetical protein
MLGWTKRTKRSFLAAIVVVVAATAWHVPPAAAVATLTIEDRTVTETNAPSSTVVNVRLSEVNKSSSVTVAFATRDGTATAPADYTATSGTLTFAPGQTIKQITIPIAGDLVGEGTETFAVDLSASSGPPIGDSSALVTITDNDSVSPRLSITDVTVREADAGTMGVAFTVNVSPVSSQEVRANWATVDGAAAAPGDFVASSGVVTIPAGATYQTVVVPVTNDVVAEVQETFNVVLSTPVNAVIGDGSGQGTIIDQDCGADTHPNTMQTAMFLGSVKGDAISPSLNLTGSICTVSDEDWFRVQVDEANSASFSLTVMATLQMQPAEGNLDLLLYDADGTLRDASNQPGTNPEAVDKVVPDSAADDGFSVFIRVRSAGGLNSSYQLRVSGDVR